MSTVTVVVTALPPEPCVIVKICAGFPAEEVPAVMVTAAFPSTRIPPPFIVLVVTPPEVTWVYGRYTPLLVLIGYGLPLISSRLPFSVALDGHAEEEPAQPVPTPSTTASS